MADEWQRVVRPEIVFLTDNFVYSARLRDILMAKKLLSPDDIEEIGLVKTTRERVHELIWKYLSKRGPGSLLKFIEALEEDDPPQSALAQRLRSHLSQEGAATTSAPVSAPVGAVASASKSLPSFSLVPIMDVLGSLLDEMVTRQELRYVAKRISSKWRYVGEALGPDPKFARHDLDGFDEMRNNRDRAQAMLDAWLEKNHEKATRRVLILALKEEGYGQLIRDVFKCDPDNV